MPDEQVGFFFSSRLKGGKNSHTYLERLITLFQNEGNWQGNHALKQEKVQSSALDANSLFKVCISAM